MSNDLAHVGASWLREQIEGLTHTIIHVSPTEFNEDKRYLPESVTPIPGFIRYAINPFMREIIDACDVDSPVRELALMKGVQITYSTALESIAFYYMAHIKTLPIMYMTADKQLADARIENNFLPMLNQSGMADIIQTSDEGNSRKTGKTANHLQFKGGGYLVPFGAQNANKMRSFSIAVMLQDEIDAWPDTVGKDGDPVALADARTDAYSSRRKIFRGSTPLILGVSKIHAAYKRGDQRKYMCLCKACSFPQELRWETEHSETGLMGGFQWELEGGILIPESVRYCCQDCGGEHFEHDKEALFSEDHGAHWKPTATPVMRDIRSYHLPGMYSPAGMKPWHALVGQFLEAFDPETRKVRDIGKYQVFTNNVLAKPWEVLGSKVSFRAVSAHRRVVYRRGEIPNLYAAEFSGSCIQFLTCQVDVHKNNLAVAVMGWTRDARCYVIDYWRFVPRDDEDDDCSELTCSVWGQLRELIEAPPGLYVADDGKQYGIIYTLIDAGYSNDTVTTFCGDYQSGVYAILGRDRSAKNQVIKEFAPFTTQAGRTGYRILVDHYKDRIAPVLRREWVEESGEQAAYHFNAPVDLTDEELRELTKETRREKIEENGGVTYYWYRPGNARNELWDLLVYGHAAVEILAWAICIQTFELETIDWKQFWNYLENEGLYYLEPERV